MHIELASTRQAISVGLGIGIVLGLASIGFTTLMLVIFG